MMLELNNVHAFYETSHILFGVSLTVNEGEVVCLLGRNGAGKTTTIRTIMGLVRARSGFVKFKDQDLRGKAPHAIAKGGVGYVPDYRGIFPDLSVEENLLVAARKGNGEGWTTGKVYEFFPNLERYRKRGGTQLSGGEQQMLTIGRTLMTNPSLLLLDEPVEGLAPQIVKTIGERLRELKEREHMTILLSEQNIKFALQISDRAYVIEKGVIKYEGLMKDLAADDEVKQRYLGV